MAKATNSGGYVQGFQEGGEGSSAGMSSLISESKLDTNGETLQVTGESPQSPAQETESHSSTPQQTSQEPKQQAQPSSVSSAAGSTQETGFSQSSPQKSLAEDILTDSKSKQQRVQRKRT